jgi:urea transport system permease protein
MRLLLILVTLALLAVPGASRAQDAAAVLAENRALVEKASRTSIGPVIAALVESGDPAVPAILTAWGDKGLGIRKSDGAFFLIFPAEGGYALRTLAGEDAGTAAKADITELRPNAGVGGGL